MDNSVKEKLVLMIKKFEDELELNSTIVDSIEKLDSTLIELQNKMDETSNSIENIFNMFELTSFKSMLNDSLVNLKKTDIMMKKIRESRKEIEDIKNDLDACNERLKDEYERIISNNNKKEKIIEDINKILLNTEELKKTSFNNNKILKNISDNAKECNEEIKENNSVIIENKKDILLNRNIIESGIEKISIIERKIDDLSNKNSLLEKMDTLEEHLILKIDEIISKNKLATNNYNMINPLMNDNNSINNKQYQSEEKTSEMLEERDIDKEIKLAIESNVDDIINKKLESLLMKVISVVCE